MDLQVVRIEGRIFGKFGKVRFEQDIGWICGHPTIKGVVLSPSRLAALLAEASDERSLNSCLQQFGGFFSFCVKIGGRVYAATDRARSRPLFFTIKSGHIRISDSTEWLMGGCAEESLTDDRAVLEFKRFGFALGSRTLVQGLSQFSAAELLICRNSGFSSSIYRNFLPEFDYRFSRPSSHIPSDDSLKAVESALLGAVSTIPNFGSRQLVVPFSGGMDSRGLLAALCALGKRKDVLAYTHGRPSAVMTRAGAAARALGVEWVSVPYTKDTWTGVWESEWFARYLSFSHSLVSIPMVRGVPAVERLRAGGLIDRHAVFLPGHSGFFPGACLPSLTDIMSLRDDPVRLVKFLCRRYGLFRLPEMHAEFFSKWIGEMVEDIAASLPTDWMPTRKLVATIEIIALRERISKLIGNSIRYFDFFGYDWWLPLWEKSFYDFWEGVVYAERFGRRSWKYSIESIERRLIVDRNAMPDFDDNDTYGPLRGRPYLAIEYFVDPNRLFDFVSFPRWVAYRFGRGAVDGSPLGHVRDAILRGAGRPILGSMVAGTGVRQTSAEGVVIEVWYNRAYGSG